ncbi:MAG: SpoIIIAH-like family protein [Clostridia bacterium]|nr:SpoIIIAH-like family protein [Clostridia bacterium]MBR4034566.1 SpoIIIAH-like family protein [Clostridia bacterium]
MNKEEFGEMIKDFFAKLGKRNLIIICSVLLVGVIAVASWALFPADKGDDLPSGADGEGEGTQDVGAQQEDSYFAASQLSRQKARDEAMEVLQSVVEDENSNEEAKATALADIAKMAEDMEAEANVETLVMSKGFAQCVAVISENGISVVVDVEETALTPAQIAQINTIVYEQTGITPDKTVIIEK